MTKNICRANSDTILVYRFLQSCFFFFGFFEFTPLLRALIPPPPKKIGVKPKSIKERTNEIFNTMISSLAMHLDSRCKRSKWSPVRVQVREECGLCYNFSLLHTRRLLESHTVKLLFTPRTDTETYRGLESFYHDSYIAWYLWKCWLLKAFWCMW